MATNYLSTVEGMSQLELEKSDNMRVKKLIELLEDESFVQRISSYSETHSKWENRSTW